MDIDEAIMCKKGQVALQTIGARANADFYKSVPRQLLADIELLTKLEADINALRLRLANGG